MNVGGAAAYFATIQTLEGLTRALGFAKKRQLPVFVMGSGSNIVVADGGYPGLVLKFASRGIEFADYVAGKTLVVAESGALWDDLVQRTVDRGLWGLENLSRIPGTVGAAPVQNIGAYGAEVADTLAWVRVYDREKKMQHILTASECGFGYRTSIFKRPEGAHLVILAAAFLLEKKGVPNLHYKDLAEFFNGTHSDLPDLFAIRRAVSAIRERKFPPLATHGTAGSFFKNPIVSLEDYRRISVRYPGMPGYAVKGGMKVPLAWILDHIGGWKGFRKGNIGTYKNQPIVIVNYGDARALEISAFARAIAEDILHRTGIAIEAEVSFVG